MKMCSLIFVQIVFKENGLPAFNRTAIGYSYAYRFVYFDIAYYIINFILPLVFLIIFNSCLIAGYRAKRRRWTLMIGHGKKEGRREKHEQNITLIMIVIIVAFLFFNTPARIIQMGSQYKRHPCPSCLYFITEFSFVLEILSSSANFFIYFVMRELFRNTLTHMLCPAIPNHLQSDRDNHLTQCISEDKLDPVILFITEETNGPHARHLTGNESEN